MRFPKLVSCVLWCVVTAGGVLLGAVAPARAQVNTVNVSGTVLDPQGLAVKGAQITLTNLATGAARTTTSEADGRYSIIGVPPGTYSMKVEAAGFAPFTNASMTLALGATAEYSPQLQLASGAQTVNVQAAPEVVDTSKTDVSTTIGQTQINDLPINGRNYINFTLLNSQAARDDTPSIGAAPTSGLNFGGQRGRSNEVSVDGADAVDNSVNGVRATVSQEAVQEFQVITSNYMPEYGRAMGGVVNIVTKSGSNEVHGDVFGFLRDSGIQARNPFSVTAACDPATLTCGTAPVKQSYTRVQGGATIGGPIQKDKTFYFFSYEITRRQETGFTNIGANNFGLVAVPGASVCSATPLLLTGPANNPSTQAGFYPAAITAAGGCSSPFAAGLIEAAALSGASSAVALFGNVSIGGTPVLPPPLQAFPEDGNPLPSTFQGLASVIGNYPISEESSIYSLRLDHIWNTANSTFLRGMVSPDTTTGIQVNAQNQTFGQNSGNRTSDQQTRDWAIIAQHTTAIASDLFNELRFQAARRGLHYGYSNLFGGSFPADNVAGAAFLGREPFTTEDRIEKRFEWTDNLTWSKGSHTIKFGGDFNLIQLGTGASQVFTLNYGGVFDFGSLTAGSLNPALTGLPSFSAVQAYGLGIPAVYYQGIGQSRKLFDNKELGVFIQDSWKINSRFTLNYGVRYDNEWLPIFAPATAFNAAAEKAFNVVEGIPADTNNVQPRIGIAWDPWGDGKTVIRAGYGFFYDHPALALAFLSTTEDGSLSAQLEAAGGSPVNPVLNPAGADLNNVGNAGVLNATNIFQGAIYSSNPNAIDPLAPAITSCSTTAPTMCFGVSGSAAPFTSTPQIFNSTFSSSLFNQQRFLTVQGYAPPPPTGSGTGYPLPILPFTIPVQHNFHYALAQQANLTIERELGKDWKISLGYNFTHGTHLDHTVNINVTNPGLLVANDSNAVQAGLASIDSNPLGISVPGNGGVPGCVPASAPLTGSVLVVVPGILGTGYSSNNCSGEPVSNGSATMLPGGTIVTPAVFNFFRPGGPNPSFAGLFPGGYAQMATLAGSLGFPTGFAGVEVPWSDVDPQSSNGSSSYNAFTLTVTKRFSHGFELLSGWTYSHSIDDSTDLSTLLSPQDNSFPELDRGNSDFDQRHRWITSMVYQSPYHSSDSGTWQKILADFTIAPIVEVSSGRPYNLLIGYDSNLDFGSSTGRPSFVKTSSAPPGSTTSPYIPGYVFIPPDHCIDSSGNPFSFPDTLPFWGCTGTLGRNAFTRPGFFDIDLRIERKIPIGERVNLDIIADGFNMLNRFNVSDVNPVCDPTAGVPTCAGGQPTAAYDPRTFQFALKVNF